jgi:hypothetical protein
VIGRPAAGRVPAARGATSRRAVGSASRTASMPRRSAVRSTGVSGRSTYRCTSQASPPTTTRARTTMNQTGSSEPTYAVRITPYPMRWCSR